MKVLASNTSNKLNNYKSAINIKKKDMLAASRAAVDIVSTNNSTVDPEIANSNDAHDKADRHNVFQLEAICVNGGIAEGITKIVG